VRFIAALAFVEPGQLLDVARSADACGLDALAISDHVCFPERIGSAYPYAPDGKPFWDATAPWPDPWVTIGAMAAVTTRLRFLTNVYVLPARHPLLVAKAVGTAAVLSGDRVILGIGVGWMREEFELLGEDFDTRGRRTDEAIGILRALWRGGAVAHHGRFYRFAPLTMSPAPSRPIPIYVGGESEPALRRAARHGDGWISVLHTRDELRPLVARLHALRAEHGRSAEPFDLVVSCSEAFDLDGCRRLEELGVTTVLTAPWLLYGGDPTSLAAKQRSLERFADEILTRMR